MKRLISLAAGSFLMFIAASKPAHADLIYQSQAEGLISTFDTVTGTTSIIGSTTVGTIDGLAFSPHGVLYGIRDNHATQNARLYVIDTLTGQATFVGQTGIPLAEGLAFGVDGTLYSMSQGNLYSVDISNANVSLLQSNLIELDGLTVSTVDVNSKSGVIPKGTIFGVRPTSENGGTTYIYTIDPVTFVQTLVHTVPLSVIDETLEFSPSGRLYGNNLDRSPGGSGWWLIDLSGDSHQLIGISSTLVTGSAIAPVAVPEPSALWCGMLALLIGKRFRGDRLVAGRRIAMSRRTAAMRSP